MPTQLAENAHCDILTSADDSPSSPDGLVATDATYATVAFCKSVGSTIDSNSLHHISRQNVAKVLDSRVCCAFANLLIARCLRVIYATQKVLKFFNLHFLNSE